MRYRKCWGLQKRKNPKSFPSIRTMTRQGFTKRCGLGLAVRTPLCMPQRDRSKNTSHAPRRKPSKWRSCNWHPNWTAMWKWRSNAVPNNDGKKEIVINHLKIQNNEENNVTGVYGIYACRCTLRKSTICGYRPCKPCIGYHQQCE